jgi:nickel/cobalt exporter
LVLTASIALAPGLAATAAHAQSSLGIGAAEPSIAPTGLGGGLIQWVNQQQQDFYRSL